MSGKRTPHVTEQESLAVAESSRQTEWTRPSFMRELFLGNFRFYLVHPFPASKPDRPEYAEFYERMKRFMLDEVDSPDIDATGDYPPHVIDGLRRMGAFGMKISTEYGGLGFSQVEYARIMELIGSLDGNIAALLSAHQSIGVPQPLKLFGSPELKKKYLPKCAAGAISAFALTEPQVGSDPARVATTAELRGDTYIINGSKLWCTNGTIAELLVVMAADPATRKISAFVVETAWDGVEVAYHSRFMGLKAISNAVIRFTNVRVPRENLIGKEGQGLKIALTTLNDGRLSIPAMSVGTAKRCLQIVRAWGNERVQWGKPIGRHEAITHKIADMAATTFAMESIAKLATAMSDQGGYDIRLEAAAAKEYNTCRGWEIVDDTVQIRGGRGYETERSLAGRGEKPIGIERIMRDFRINRIFEGSSEIMHLFMAREAVDKHLQVAGTLIDTKKKMGEKLKALPKVARFYGWWYPSRWIGSMQRYSEFGELGGHLRFASGASRKLARQVFHGMLRHGPKLQNKQAFLFRLVDVGNELFAMTASVARAQALRGSDQGKEAVQLADLFCRNARRKIERLFYELWSNDDVLKYRTGIAVLEGHRWTDTGVPTLEETVEALQKNLPVQVSTAPEATHSL
jgi:alkylation response protein AidB-like acyl-CoA dehydrogenase